VQDLQQSGERGTAEARTGAEVRLIAEFARGSHSLERVEPHGGDELGKTLIPAAHKLDATVPGAALTCYGLKREGRFP
jgi:hypothetical protein